MSKIMMRVGNSGLRPVRWHDANQEGLGELLQLLSQDGGIVLQFEDDDAALPEDTEEWEDHSLTHPMTSDGGWMND